MTVCIRSGMLLGKKRLHVNNHLAAVLETIIVIDGVRFRLVKSFLSVGHGRRDEGWVHRGVLVYKVSLAIQVATELNHALARKDTKDLTLVVGKLCKSMLVI